MRVRRWLDARTTAYVVVALMLLAQIAFGFQLRTVYRCQQKYATETAHALAERDGAAKADRAAFDQMFAVLLDTTATPADRYQALLTYSEVRRESDQLREAHPYPAPRTC
jgi:hypothetical protein